MEMVRKKQGSYRGKTYAKQGEWQVSRYIDGESKKLARKL